MGGGLAAARTAEQLRRFEYTGPITIVSDEEHLPYDRPPLSKEVLRAETDDVTLKPAEFYDENDITVLLGKAARSIDAATQTLKLADGSELAYDELIIATGLVPKRIPSFPDLPGIHVLRSFDESLRLRGEAGAARNAVVVGAGFIGCEVAASLRGLGVDVVLVEPQPAPLASVLGEQIGSLVARLHRAEGVDVRCGVGVADVRGTEKVEKVVLSDGAELDADIVVVGIGSRPATGWLEGTGIEVLGGFVTYLALSLLFGLVNAVVGPLLHLVALPLSVFTVGGSALVVNGVLLALTALLSARLDVAGLGSAVLGSLVISIVTTVVELVIRPIREPGVDQGSGSN